MGGTCPSCGEAVAHTYECRDCGAAFCVDCRLPDDHDCTPSDDGAANDGAGTLDTLRRRWGGVSGPVAAGVTVALVAVALASFRLGLPRELVVLSGWGAVLALVSHVRLTRAAVVDGWRPSAGYYLPVLPALLVAIVVAEDLVGRLALSGVGGSMAVLLAALVYAGQHRRHRDAMERDVDALADAGADDALVDEPLAEAQDAAGRARAAEEADDADRAATAYERAVDSAETARERASEHFPDRVDEIEAYIERLRAERESAAAEAEG